MNAAVDDAALGKCPEHPEQNAGHTCGRCGRFLCATCTHLTSKQPLCEPCFRLQAKTEAGPFTLNMVLPFLALLGTVFFGVVHIEEDIVMPRDTGQVIAVGTALLMILAALFLTFRFLFRKRGVPQQLVVFYGVSFLLRTFDIATS